MNVPRDFRLRSGTNGAGAVPSFEAGTELTDEQRTDFPTVHEAPARAFGCRTRTYCGARSLREARKPSAPRRGYAWTNASKWKATHVSESHWMGVIVSSRRRIGSDSSTWRLGDHRRRTFIFDPSRRRYRCPRPRDNSGVQRISANSVRTFGRCFRGPIGQRGRSQNGGRNGYNPRRAARLSPSEYRGRRRGGADAIGAEYDRRRL